MCCQKAKWKREIVNNHKFDFVWVEDFKIKGVFVTLKYIFLHLIVFKIVLVYIADLWTAGFLLIFDSWSSTITPSIPFAYSKWIYVGCIFISFLLLALDWSKAKDIIASRDISYAFTSTITYRIKNQSRIVDKIAFFVFFSFKGWKRILLAEAPRQVISAITLYPIIKTNITKDWMNLSAYGHNTAERLTMALMAFTILSFVLSASKLTVAFILYIPLLFHIRGNLKEYCCHKIDKRIEELLKKNSRKRRAKQKMDARANDDRRRRNKVIANNQRQPTLPDLDKPSPIPHNSRFSEQVEQTMMTYRPPIPPPHLNPLPLPPRTIPPEFSYNSEFRPPPPRPPPELTHNRYQPPPPFTSNSNPPPQYAPQNDYYLF